MRPDGFAGCREPTRDNIASCLHRRHDMLRQAAIDHDVLMRHGLWTICIRPVMSRHPGRLAGARRGSVLAVLALLCATVGLRLHL